MKKVVSLLAVGAFLFTLNVNAQEPKKAKKAKAKTEKYSTTADATVAPAASDKKGCSDASAKSCSSSSGKKSCCAAKKEEAKS